MQLHLRLRAAEPLGVDWFAAGVAGLAAGALLMVLELAWAASVGGENPWRLSQLVAAIVLGPDVAAQPAPVGFDIVIVGVALLTHYVLGIGFGLLLGWVLAKLHRGGQLGVGEAVGALFGIVLYLINFHALTGLFPWFVELRGWSTLIAHLVFGIAAAVLYWRLARPRSRNWSVRPA